MAASVSLAAARAWVAVTTAAEPIASRRLAPVLPDPFGRYSTIHDLKPDGMIRRPKPGSSESYRTMIRDPGFAAVTVLAVSLVVGIALCLVSPPCRRTRGHERRRRVTLSSAKCPIRLASGCVHQRREITGNLIPLD